MLKNSYFLKNLYQEILLIFDISLTFQLSTHSYALAKEMIHVKKVLVFVLLMFGLCISQTVNGDQTYQKTNDMESKKTIRLLESQDLNQISDIKTNIGILGEIEKLWTYSKNYYCGGSLLSKKRISSEWRIGESNQMIVKTIYGFNMAVDKRAKFVSSSMQQFGTWKPKYIHLFSKILKKGDKVLNLGSQSGLESLTMGKIIGPTGKLFIFEPYSFSNNLVTKNIELNGLKNITTIYKFGASDEKSSGIIKVNYQNTGAQNNQQQQVRLDRVDALLPSDVSLDFALIDLQKIEIKALQGMKGVIEKSPNLIIMLEWLQLQNKLRNEQQILRALRFMIDRGYKTYTYVDGDYSRCKLGKFKEIDVLGNLSKFAQTDIFFIPDRPKEMSQRNINFAQLYCGPQIFRNYKINLKQPNPSGRQKLVRTSYGFDMFIDSFDTVVSIWIEQTGTWQPKFIHLVSKILKKGDKVLNLGSQSGLESLTMGKIIGPTGKLFIFEPYSFSNNLVTKNIELNGLKNITTIYKFGASDEKSSGIIKVNYQNTGASSIVPESTAKSNEEQQVYLERVDALLPSDVSLDFALIDVQKMEIKALQGMKGVIERSPNLIIMSEWLYLQNKLRNEQQALRVLRYMTERGYKIYTYGGGDDFTRCKLGKFKEVGAIENLLKFSQTDIFFFPKGYKFPG